jgi:hypothetical protein
LIIRRELILASHIAQIPSYAFFTQPTVSFSREATGMAMTLRSQITAIKKAGMPCGIPAHPT